MAWWNRTPVVKQAGSVLFRGKWQARPQDFASLGEHGVTIGPETKDDRGGWRAPLSHPRWGQAMLSWAPDAPLPPEVLVDWDPRLNDEERAEVKQAGALISVSAEAKAGNVLVDRKQLLRFLHAVMGKEGVAVVDHTAQAFWSREALADELSHDAELDIEALFTVHAVHDGASAHESTYWLHSHGLSEIGFTDFDVLQPSGELLGRAQDLLRALAFGVVEGKLTPGGGPVPLMDDNLVQLVAAKALRASLPETEFPKWRGDVDQTHLEGHAIVCDAPGTGFFARLFGRDRLQPSRFLRGPFPDEVLIMFSNASTELMARRARQMLPVLKAASEELRELKFPALVKLGYETDGGSTSTEHLWFEVHGFQGDTVDATLINRPFHIARMKEHDRGHHPLALLSDWAIMTPFGQINARSTRTLRMVRANKEKLKSLMAMMEDPAGNQ